MRAARFYQAASAAGGFAFNGSFPGTNPNDNRDWFGFIEPAGPSLRQPGRLTEYAGGTGSARMEWFGQYSPGPVPSEPGDIRLLHPGERLAENWDAYPDLRAVHPDPGLRGTADDDADLRRGRTAAGRHGTGRAPGAARAGRAPASGAGRPGDPCVGVGVLRRRQDLAPRPVSRHGGRCAAVFTAPPGALVTLRTSAAGSAGGTVTETITSAYRTGR